MAGGAAIIPLRYPLRPRIQFTESLYLNKNLTLRITRPPTPLLMMTSSVSRVACMRLLGRPRAPPRNAHSIAAAHSGDLTPPITRRPARRLCMTTRVSAVGCIGLFGRDAASTTRGARAAHHLHLTPQPEELNHAPLATRNCFLS
jgi:hypothetical protein